MKKVLNILLSVLMMATLMTVNVFGEGEIQFPESDYEKFSGNSLSGSSSGKFTLRYNGIYGNVSYSGTTGEKENCPYSVEPNEYLEFIVTPTANNMPNNDTIAPIARVNFYDGKTTFIVASDSGVHLNDNDKTYNLPEVRNNGDGTYTVKYHPDSFIGYFEMFINWTFNEYEFSDSWVDNANVVFGNSDGSGYVDYTSTSGEIYRYGGETKLFFTENNITMKFIPENEGELLCVRYNDIDYCKDKSMGNNLFADGGIVSSGSGIYELSISKDMLNNYNQFLVDAFFSDTPQGDLVIDNTGFGKREYNNNTYYMPFEYFGANEGDIEEALDISASGRKIIANFNYGPCYSGTRVGYNQGYIFRQSMYYVMEFYDVTEADSLDGKTFEDLQEYRINLKKPLVIEMMFNEFDDEEEANQYVEYIQNQFVIYREQNNNQYITHDDGLSNSGRYRSFYENNVWNTAIKVSVSGAGGMYYVCRPIDIDGEDSKTPATTSVSGITSLSELVSEVEKRIRQTGLYVTLENGTYSANEPLVLRNYGIAGDADLYNYSTDIAIDLNGSTINLGNNSIEIEANSKVHIINGTIVGNGNSLINNYGSVSLESITLQYSGNGTAINSKGGFVNIDQNTSISSSGKGIVASEKSVGVANGPGEINFFGKVYAKDDALTLNDPENHSHSMIRLVANDDGVKNDAGNNPTVISENGYGILANEFSLITIHGYEESGDVRNVIIKAPTAIAVNGGTLKIENYVDVESAASGKPLVEVLSTNDEKQEININVSRGSNLSSSGCVVKDSGAKKLIEKIEIISDELYPNNSKTVYTNNDPFEISYSPNYVITGGIYSTSGISNYVNTSLYDIVQHQTIANMWHVKGKSRFGETYTFDDTEKASSSGLNNLGEALRSVGTRHVFINAEVDPGNNYLDYQVKGSKDIYINSDVKNVCFTVNQDADQNMVEFKKSDSSKTYSIISDKTIIKVQKGEVIICDDVVNETSQTEPAVLVTGGHLSIRENTGYIRSVSGTAIKVDTENKGTVQVFGNIEAKVAAEIVNIGLGETDGFWIEKNGDENSQPYIKGVIDSKSGRVIVRAGTLDGSQSNEAALTLSNNATLFMYDGEIVGNKEAIRLSDNGNLEIQGGKMSGDDVIVVDYEQNDNPYIGISNSPYFMATSNSGSVIKMTRNGNVLNKNEYIDRDGWMSLEFIATGGFYSHLVTKEQIRILDSIMSPETENEGMYKCIQYQPIASSYPYTIIYDKTKYASYDGGAALVIEDSPIEIQADEDQLHKIKDQYGKDEWTVMVADEIEADEAGSGFSKYDVDNYLDIYINDIVNINSVNKIDNTNDYQFVTMTVGNGKAEKTVIFHKHANLDPTPMEKVSSEKGNSMKENKNERKECYYVSGDDKVTVVTQRFSIFGLSIGEDNVDVGTNDVLVSASGKAIDLNISSSGSGADFDNNIISSSIQEVINSGSGAKAKMSSELVEFLEAHKSESGLQINVEVVSNESNDTSVSGQIGASGTPVAMQDITIKVTMSCGGENVEGYITKLTTPVSVRINLPTDVPTTSSNPNKQIKYYALIKHSETFLDPILVTIKTDETTQEKYVEVPSDKFSIYTIYYKLEDKAKDSSNKNNSYSVVKTGTK